MSTGKGKVPSKSQGGEQDKRNDNGQDNGADKGSKSTAGSVPKGRKPKVPLDRLVWRAVDIFLIGGNRGDVLKAWQNMTSEDEHDGEEYKAGKRCMQYYISTIHHAVDNKPLSADQQKVEAMATVYGKASRYIREKRKIPNSSEIPPQPAVASSCPQFTHQAQNVENPPAAAPWPTYGLANDTLPFNPSSNSLLPPVEQLRAFHLEDNTQQYTTEALMLPSNHVGPYFGNHFWGQHRSQFQTVYGPQNLFVDLCDEALDTTNSFSTHASVPEHLQAMSSSPLNNWAIVTPRMYDPTNYGASLASTLSSASQQTASSYNPGSLPINLPNCYHSGHEAQLSQIDTSSYEIPEEQMPEFDARHTPSIYGGYADSDDPELFPFEDANTIQDGMSQSMDLDQTPSASMLVPSSKSAGKAKCGQHQPQWTSRGH